MRRTFRSPLGLALAVWLGSTGCDDSGDGSAGGIGIGAATSSTCGTDSGTGCAPESARVDLFEPSFTSPTEIVNSLYPIASLHSVVILGESEGLPLKVEVTLLPDPRTVTVNGQQLEALVSQFVAFREGRLHEVALDLYAQADDGSVWYLGEDVFNYENGVIADTEGSWLVDRDGPPAMIMPASPRVGEVYRSENIPGLVFEEVTVTQTGVTVTGPSGTVHGAIVGRELHLDGTNEEKTFAPGYGEFFTGSGEEFEALALAVPTDAPGTPLPPELALVAAGPEQLLPSLAREDWTAISTRIARMRTAWDRYRAAELPPLLETQLEEALLALEAAARTKRVAPTTQAAIVVAQAALDLELRHRRPVDVDRGRFAWWTRQLAFDAAARDSGAIAGDVATLEVIRDRIAHALDPAALAALDAELEQGRAAAEASDFAAAKACAVRLEAMITHVRPAI